MSENGSYTPPIHGDPRAMSQSPDRQGVAFLTLPPTRPDALTSKVELRGDVAAAGKYVPLVTQQMMAMHRGNVNNLEVVDRPVDLGDGNRMFCQRRFTEDRALISVPGASKKDLGPLHLNFDPSQQSEFGQTIFDKLNGLPFYFNNWVDMELSAQGATATGGARGYGTVMFDPKGSSPTEKTAFYAITLGHNFSDPTGTAQMQTLFRGPASSMDMDLSYYGTGYPTRGRLDVTLPTGATYSESNLNDSHRTIIGVRTKSRDVTYNEGGSASFTSVTELFVDGIKRDEIEENRSSWGSYYGDQRNQLYSSLDGPGNSSITLNQKLLYGAHLSDDNMTEVTDNIAAKWGF